MLMRAQNGDNVVNSNTLVALYRSKNLVYCCITNEESEIGALMGTYNSVAEAQKAIELCFQAAANNFATFQF